MKNFTYSTDIDNPFLHTSLESLGWRADENSFVFLSELASEQRDCWQIVTDNTIQKENVIVVEEFGLDTLDGVLSSLSRSYTSNVLRALFQNEEKLFDSLFESRITSYDEFPLNEVLSFLSNWEDLNNISEQEKVSYFLFSVLDIEVELKTFEELSNSQNYSNILRAHSSSSELFYCFKEEVEIDSEFKLIFTLLLIYQDQKIEKEQIESYSKSDWEIILNSLSLPTCLVSSQGELVLHNTAFSSLGLYASDCLKFKNSTTIENSDKVLKVFRDSIRITGKDYESFVFITDTALSKDGNITISSEELGIISGSIAHELNNPIAGILAALTLLKLEDDLPEDSLVVLDDMEKGAKRCKKLIEVFLGFSRLDPMKTECDSLENSLDQSLSLLRSRMVESNLKMNIEYQVIEKFDKALNNSIASMIFYLVLSEGFTLGNHQKLLISDLQQINIKVEETKREMKFSFSLDVKLYEQLQNSKLFLHLLNILDIEFLGHESTIRLRLYDS